LSEEAVKKSKNKYGDFYRYGDLFKLAEIGKEKYDCVIMTEIIEHVENPKDFIMAAISLLKENGKLILTTPNKNTSPSGVIWQSDVPPVHL
jgi:2-polyprenyl-3-methyl-5-hydroxy-6-metoxy-1,4-benzoquinol methylase